MPLRHGGGRRERRRKTGEKVREGWGAEIKTRFSPPFFLLRRNSEAALHTSRARPRILPRPSTGLEIQDHRADPQDAWIRDEIDDPAVPVR